MTGGPKDRHEITFTGSAANADLSLPMLKIMAYSLTTRPLLCSLDLIKQASQPVFAAAPRIASYQ